MVPYCWHVTNEICRRMSCNHNKRFNWNANRNAEYCEDPVGNDKRSSLNSYKICSMSRPKETRTPTESQTFTEEREWYVVTRAKIADMTVKVILGISRQLFWPSLVSLVLTNLRRRDILSFSSHSSHQQSIGKQVIYLFLIASICKDKNLTESNMIFNNHNRDRTQARSPASWHWARGGSPQILQALQRSRQWQYWLHLQLYSSKC